MDIKEWDSQPYILHIFVVNLCFVNTRILVKDLLKRLYPEFSVSAEQCLLGQFSGSPMATKDVTVLFDESGTPQIVGKYRNEWFLGCGVIYEQSAEIEIFARCSEAVGLCKNKPMKNHRISIDRVIRIARILTDLPLTIYVSGIDTTDPEFRRIVKDYMRFGRKTRAIHRPEVRDRSIGQIIHSHVLDHCLFHSIADYFESGGSDAHVSLFIDN